MFEKYKARALKIAYICKKISRMKKEFNITETCYADLHYMMDNSAKLNAILDLVKKGKYFTINRPRQYGKTTAIHGLYEILEDSEDFLPIKINFQGIDDKWQQSDEDFAKMFINLVADFFCLDISD